MDLKIVSLLAFALAVGAVVYLYEEGHIFSRQPVTVALQVFGAALMIWARLTFGIRSFNASANTTKGKLITSGPYRWFRHPIYAAIIYFFIGSLIAYPTLETIIAFIIITAALFVRMLLEEKSLLNTYPGYEDYCRRTKRIIPFVF